MSKELEALERGILEFEKELEDDCNNEWLKRVVAGMKKCYQRLEALDNANPSEALECFEAIEEYGEWSEFNTSLSHDFPKEYNTIKQALLKAQEDEKENAELKRVLEIVKEKKVEMALFNDSKTVEDYNYNRNWGAKELTQEEFDLLKRYFK